MQPKPSNAVTGIIELEAYLRQHVLATDIPTRWLIVEELPQNVSLKVDRPAMARLFDEPTPAGATMAAG